MAEELAFIYMDGEGFWELDKTSRAWYFILYDCAVVPFLILLVPFLEVPLQYSFGSDYG